MKKRLLHLFPSILVILLFLPATAEAQEIGEFKREQFIEKNDTLNYRILYPSNFSKEEKYPVVLFYTGPGSGAIIMNHN